MKVHKKGKILKSTYKILLLSILSIAIFSSCSSKKRKGGGEPSVLSKFYHNTTAQYNGYFNANELLKESYTTLKDQHRDNYNDILPLYDYVSVNDPKTVYANLDKAIEKVTTVAALHKPSKWVDDCYVLMGEAQYLKQEYETAEETFAFFKDEFNPENPFGRNYKKKKKSKKAIKKEKDKERKAKKKERDEQKKADKKAKEKERKAKKKAKEEEAKAKKKERERIQKERDAERKRRKKKSRKKKSRKKNRKNRKTRDADKAVETKVETVTKKTDAKVEPKITKADPVVKKEEEKKSQREENISNSKKKDEKKKKDKTAYSKGMMWYAKTLVQREKYSNASYLVKSLNDDGQMPEDAKREVPVILADINIRENNFGQAISYLDEAISSAKEKSLKARYAFVQGQLYQKEKKYNAAANSFADAKKWAKSFEMEFMSELNTEKTKMMSGTTSKDAVIDKLDRMAKQDKYDEYLDQIYFTKGEILLEGGDFDAALASFTKSISNNVDNIGLKQETYYKLANLFYEKEAYVDAKNYFDSTLIVLDKDDKRHNEVENYAKNLTEIAKNIGIITYQDSLLSMTDWTDDKIKSIAEKMLEENKKSIISEGANNKKSNKNISGIGSSLKKSSFFAYDQQAKERGKKEFKNTWGEITLADNWRRSEKSGVFGETEIKEEKIAEDGFAEDEITRMISSIKSKIPYSDKAKNAIYNKMKLAYFALGKAYGDKIQNYEKSSETLEILLNRFPDFEQKLDVYYYLYLSYLDQNNNTKANYYKEKVLSEFPDSEYAKAISDPNFGAKQLSAEQKLNKYYEETYNLFDKRNYKGALSKAEESDAIFGKDNALRPKFYLVKAMASGNVHGKEKYIQALNDVITRFPGTPEKARANEILRFLQGDQDAFTGVNVEEVDDIFSVEDGKLHYVAVVMYDATSEDVVNAKISISNYNKQYHKLKKLQLGESPLDRKKKSEIILIRRFENKEKAMEYYNEIKKSKNEFIPSELGGYTIYPITQRNYRKMLMERSDVRYRVFFDKNYLGK